jgi:hypothetical protein
MDRYERVRDVTHSESFLQIKAWVGKGQLDAAADASIFGWIAD